MEPMIINLRDRKCLQEIRDKSRECFFGSDKYSEWYRAYCSMADSADRIDAMIARTQVDEGN